MTDWAAILREQEHRPYALPAAPFAVTMSWHGLLFAHFEVELSALRAAVPSGLELDLWQGKAWVGVVPFYMSQVGSPALNQLPWTSAFEEFNVRTYVTHGGRGGVYTTDGAGVVYRGEIQHPPWPLQAAQADISTNEMGRPHGLSLNAERPLLHFARRLDVLAWPLERAQNGSEPCRSEA